MEKLTDGQKNRIRKIIKYTKQIENATDKILYWSLGTAFLALCTTTDVFYIINNYHSNDSLFNDLCSAILFILGTPATVLAVIVTIKNIAEKIGLDLKKANLENYLNLVPDYDVNQLEKLVEEPPKEEQIFSR